MALDVTPTLRFTLLRKNDVCMQARVASRSTTSLSRVAQGPQSPSFAHVATTCANVGWRVEVRRKSLYAKMLASVAPTWCYSSVRMLLGLGNIRVSLPQGPWRQSLSTSSTTLTQPGVCLSFLFIPSSHFIPTCEETPLRLIWMPNSTPGNRVTRSWRERKPPTRTLSRTSEDGEDGAYYAQDAACITMLSGAYPTTGAISKMHGHTEHSRAQCACTL